MIYARGISLWHGVRTFGDRITTLCGRRLTEPFLTDVAPPKIFLCQTCALVIERSPSVVGA